MKNILLKTLVIFILIVVFFGFGKNVYTNPKDYEEEKITKSEEYEIKSEPIKEESITDKIEEPKEVQIFSAKSSLQEESNSETKVKEPEKTEKAEEIKETTEIKEEKKEEIVERKVSNGYTVVIDAGHQLKANTEKEPIGPGSLEMKQKVSSGTQGISSHLPEYELTLDVALRLKELLINEGYEVIMIRETNDVNISNAERAEIANNSGADIFIRLHADGDENETVKGVTTLCPTENNEYCSNIATDSYNLSKYIVDELSKETKDTNRGVSRVDNMTGINYCKIPVSIVEMGFMTNIETDNLFQTDEYKDKIAIGILNGINNYFKG